MMKSEAEVRARLEVLDAEFAWMKKNKCLLAWMRGNRTGAVMLRWMLGGGGGG